MDGLIKRLGEHQGLRGLIEHERFDCARKASTKRGAIGGRIGAPFRIVSVVGRVACLANLV